MNDTQLITPPNLVDLLKSRHLLIDTNVLIGAIDNPKELGELFSILKNMNCTVVATKGVRLEFISSSKSIADHRKKVAFFNDAVDTLLPERPEVNLGDSLLYAFGHQAGKFSAIDYLLAQQLAQYGKHLFLLSSNSRDFTTQLFDIKGAINSVFLKSASTYYLYQFSQEKYAEILKRAIA